MRGPAATVDVVIELADEPGRIVFVERRNEPRGWALPGGFVDLGEPVEDAARREAEEETGLEVELVTLLGVYSSPERDPRLHSSSAAFVARARGQPQGADDAAQALAADPHAPPGPLVFDHARIVGDYVSWRKTGHPPQPGAGRWLARSERSRLLAIARASAEAAARGEPLPPLPESLPPRLMRPAACFVTLHLGGELRGCIGTIRADQPLAQAARELGESSARRDPRFPPLRASELPGLHVEVSVLSVPVRSAPPAVEIGRHGLILTLDGRRGLLLPQVATEHHLSREAFLDAVSRKAGLAPTAWHDPNAVLEVFSAQVFGE